MGELDCDLNRSLKLKLPEGRTRIVDELDITMNALNNFDPDVFNGAFQKLHKQLSKEPPRPR